MLLQIVLPTYMGLSLLVIREYAQILGGVKVSNLVRTVPLVQRLEPPAHNRKVGGSNPPRYIRSFHTPKV